MNCRAAGTVTVPFVALCNFLASFDGKSYRLQPVCSRCMEISSKEEFFRSGIRIIDVWFT